MISYRRRRNDLQKGSFSIALVFIIIAVVGMILMYKSPPGGKELYQKDKLSPEKVQENEVGRLGYSGYFLRVVLATGAIVGLFILGAAWFRRQSHLKNTNKLKVDILGRQYISPKHSLLMVRIEGRRFLLGVADNAINLVSEFQEQFESMESEATTSPTTDSFKRILKKFKIENKS